MDLDWKAGFRIYLVFEIELFWMILFETVVTVISGGSLWPPKANLTFGYNFLCRFLCEKSLNSWFPAKIIGTLVIMYNSGANPTLKQTLSFDVPFLLQSLLCFVFYQNSILAISLLWCFDLQRILDPFVLQCIKKIDF